MTDLDRRAARLARTQQSLLTRQQATDLGLSPTAIRLRVRRGRWRPVARGLYLINGTTFDWLTRVKAAQLTTGGVASHRTAAVLLGVRDFAQGTPELSVPRGRHHANPLAVRLHVSTDLDLCRPMRVHGIDVTPPSRLAVDLGAVVSYPAYEAAVEDLVACRRVAWTDLLDAYAMHGRRGRDGVGSLRRVLDDRMGTTIAVSVLERRFEQLLRTAGLPMPVAQHEVFLDGEFIARVDYAYPELGVVIELDGLRYHAPTATREKDYRKRARMTAAGLTVLAFTWEMVVQDRVMVCDTVDAAVRRPNCRF